jgi:hypothetical protein
MKTIKLTYFSIIILTLFLSCKDDNRKNYAIRDFRRSIQPGLIKIVSKGIVMYSDSSIWYMATDKELVELTQSENPVLRATALKEMLRRPSFNHFDVIMNHLDDTAMVATDAGEFGIYNMTVSDHILEYGKWKSMSEKNKTIHEVITKHNYLKSAYTILPRIEPQEKYYAYIKEMVQANKPFDEIEYALYALAKFKRNDDVQLIKRILMSNYWGMTEYSFQLMQEFPNDTYLDVYEEFYPKNFYYSITRTQNPQNAIDFIKSIATYKNNRSAIILNKILTKKPEPPIIKTGWFRDELVHAIWNNECPEYSTMRKQIKATVEEIERHTFTLPQSEPKSFPVDTSFEPIRHW